MTDSAAGTTVPYDMKNPTSHPYCPKETLAANLADIRERVGEACARRNRNPEDVTLVAVTKSVDVRTIRHLLELGHVSVGEQRVQQLLERHRQIEEHRVQRGRLPLVEDEPLPEPQWHMIGHLQRNKVKAILPFLKVIHSVDSLRLAEEINTAAARLGLDHKVSVFLQVNTSEEPQKHGIAVGAAGALAEQIETLANLRLAGLMTMAPLTDNVEQARFCFARLHEILEDMVTQSLVGPQCRELSMGMSQDYEVAVEEGATHIRIGTNLFQPL